MLVLQQFLNDDSAIEDLFIRVLSGSEFSLLFSQQFLGFTFSRFSLISNHSKIVLLIILNRLINL